ncbi:MAG: glutathione S-transferase N-terminal domain-containing protein [Pseudomonadota bacterium]
MLTLHVGKNSIALAAHAALEEAGCAYDVAWVDLAAGDQHGAAYQALNPKGRVPTLITPEGPLTEVVAILEWIAATQAPHLMPDTPWHAAKAREMMLYVAATMHVAHAHRFRGHRWTDDADAQAALTAHVPQAMAACAAHVEGQLTGDWVGDAFCVADLHLWTVARWLPGDGVAMDGYPKLRALCDRVAARPAVARVVKLHG